MANQRGVEANGPWLVFGPKGFGFQVTIDDSQVERKNPARHGKF